jgi:hypothetical protein
MQRCHVKIFPLATSFKEAAALARTGVEGLRADLFG